MAASTALTDDRGEYRIFELKPGEYYVKASESEVFWHSVTEDGLDWIARDKSGHPICSSLLSRSDPTRPGAICRARCWRGSGGRIRHAAGEDRRGRRAHPRRRRKSRERCLSLGFTAREAGNWRDQPSASTNAKGEFTIKGVPPGSYISALSNRIRRQRQFAQQKLEVGNENIDSVLLAFSQGYNHSSDGS